MSDNQGRAVQLTFRGYRNVTYTGTLLLNNLTADNFDNAAAKVNGTEKDDYDNRGASYYVIAVVLVYGMSIVMLIASHIKRRVDKVVEDKQIDRYLQDFQIVKERHARDSYKNLKRAVIKKINWEKQRKPTFQNLQKNMLPLIAIGMPVADPMNEDAQSISSSLSNVDLAAAEQYMIAKDKGKVYQGRKTSNVMTAEYIAAARKHSRDQSPHSLAKMFRERKISRDHGVHGIYAPPSAFLDPSASVMYHERSRASSFVQADILREEDEPSEEESSPENQRQSPENGDREKVQLPKSRGFHIGLPLKKVQAEINTDNQGFTGRSPHSNSPVKHELLVPVPWYNNRPDSSGSRSPSPTGSGYLSPGYRSHRSHSSGSVPGYALPVSPSRESHRLSSSPRSTSSILSDGSREELIQITCL